MYRLFVSYPDLQTFEELVSFYTHLRSHIGADSSEVSFQPLYCFLVSVSQCNHFFDNSTVQIGDRNEISAAKPQTIGDLCLKLGDAD